MVRFIMAAAFSFVLASGSASIAQQAAPDDPAPDAPPGAGAPPKAEGPAGDRANPVDDLLGRLSRTEDERAAKRIASAVQALWMRSGSDTVDLLTARSGEAQRAQKLDIAIKLMDEAIGLRPDFTEGWNRRATLHFLAKDYDEAMSDLHEVLIREPRHFGAWVGLGRILADAGFEARALAAYRKALEIYPAIDGLKKQVDELKLKVEGQPI
ncbi:tetratricopeptide repeat protein [Hansschlegelia zhihuaiae]|uniref:Tetratricopeptide repeat protein n=1 Tax=Hansschlegelia zhihuaiae TaxID=405005 RepID=A0A4Q0MR46_9HYPH|nr:tetratricopeptide repeat protein [Hansschlegelia zhihuaiae]RXF75616.1 tetratricopeptide repeat protein [Hansschlegelia zhihuaiae]